MPAAEAQAAYDALHPETTPFEPAMIGISARYAHKQVSVGDRSGPSARVRLDLGSRSRRAARKPRSAAELFQMMRRVSLASSAESLLHAEQPGRFLACALIFPRAVHGLIQGAKRAWQPLDKCELLNWSFLHLTT
jgi:hypothetical protein